MKNLLSKSNIEFGPTARVPQPSELFRCRAALCMVNIKRKKLHARSGHKNDEDRPGCCYQQNPCQVIRLNQKDQPLKVEKSSDTQLLHAWQLTYYDSLLIRTCFRIQPTLLCTATFFPSHCLRSTTEVMVLLKISPPMT